MNYVIEIDEGKFLPSIAILNLKKGLKYKRQIYRIKSISILDLGGGQKNKTALSIECADGTKLVGTAKTKDVPGILNVVEKIKNLQNSIQPDLEEHKHSNEIYTALMKLLAGVVLFFLIFLLLSSGVLSLDKGNWFYGTLLIVSTALILPPVRKRLPAGLNKLRYIMLAMVLAFIFFEMVPHGKEISKRQAERLAKAEAQKEKSIAEAKAEHQADPDGIKKEISDLIDEKNYKKARKKAQIFLSTDDPEIIELYEIAIEEQRKVVAEQESAERKRQQKSAGYPEAPARRMCEQAIRSSANNPSTLKIHSILGYGTTVNAEGVRVTIQSFSAKNAFGLEKSYDAYCVLTPDGEFEISVVEKGG